MIQFTRDRHNNFGIIRLVLASMVILSHSPEILDGNRSREILTRLFGTVSFGELAVDAFFIISGYLIAQSFENDRSVFHYVLRRFARIVPGYVVCFLVCVFIVAPLAGGNPWQPGVLLHNIGQMVKLGLPQVPGVFAGMHYPSLNGSMWTIAFEFRCYLGIVALGLLGLFRADRRKLVLGLALALLAVNAVSSGFTHGPPGSKVGFVLLNARLAGLFLCGTSFYLYRRSIPLNGAFAAVCAALLCGFLFFPATAEAAIGLFGSYLIFWLALGAPQLPAGAVFNRFDPSYGIYLYAWPVQMLLIWWGVTLNPWILSLFTLAVTVPLASLSWFMLEKPALGILVPRSPRPA